jgi:hypothetical protein
MLSEAIRAAAYVLRKGEKICYTYMKLEGNGSNIDDFLNDLNFVATNPDDSVDYDPNAINPNAGNTNFDSPLLKDDGTVEETLDFTPKEEAPAEPEEPQTDEPEKTENTSLFGRLKNSVCHIFSIH